MDKRFAEKMKKKLNSLKQGILSYLAQEDAEFRALFEAIDPKDVIDLASEDIDRKTLEALGAQETRRLNKIESALVRIPTGKYGSCMKCDNLIPKERLEAIPYALLCINCQSSQERQKR